MQARFSSAIGGAAPLAAVRQRSRREVRRIMQCGRLPVILSAISWAYGRRFLILPAMQRLRSLRLIRVFLGPPSFLAIAFPAIVRIVLRRHKKWCLPLVEPQALMAHGSIRTVRVVVVSPRLKSTFLRDAGGEGKRLRR